MSSEKQTPPSYPAATDYTANEQYPQATGTVQPDQQIYNAPAPQHSESYAPHKEQEQQRGAPQTYQQAAGGYTTPLQLLQSSPAQIDCPNCRQRALTVATPRSGNTTHAWAVALFLTTCCCCIPYLITGTKDVDHKCGNCGIPVATWHRSGRTEVRAG